MAKNTPHPPDPEVEELKSKHLREGYKKGGIVRKTGITMVHKGEYVIPSHEVKKIRKSTRVDRRGR